VTNIIIFSDFYFPSVKAGGPLKSISLIAGDLSRNNRIVIYTSTKDKNSKNELKNISKETLVKRDKYYIFYTRHPLLNLIPFISNSRPSILWLNSFFSFTTIAVLILTKISFTNTHVLISPRGELLEGALNIKNFKKIFYLYVTNFVGLFKNTYFHVTSEDEVYSIKNKIREFRKIYSIHNLIKSSNLSPLKRDSEKLKIIFLSRISKKKNLFFALKILGQIKNILIQFDIYGPIEDYNYWTQCKFLIKTIPPNISISYRGLIFSEDVTKRLRNYHVFFLPTMDENFGHAIVEAMQSGVLPLISDNTPWKDVADYNAGWALSLDKPIDFVNAIVEISRLNAESFYLKSSNCINYIKNKCNNEISSSNYRNMIKDILNST
jgi:glycosyltransferase involved in cell wall biosynthesis